MDSKLKKITSLFITFFKIGAFTFGGGYAMIPLIQKEVAEEKGWITDEEILDVIAIAESTPGPIAINSATFVGYKVCGFAGAFFSTLGVVIPSFVIILLISFLLREFAELKPVKYAFFGVRAGVLALVLKAFVTMSKKCPKNIVSYILAALAFIIVVLFDINVIYIILGCAVIGLVSSLIAGRRVK